MNWPTTSEDLVNEQHRLASVTPDRWSPPARPRIGACFVCFERGAGGPGHRGDPAWAAAAVGDEVVVLRGEAAGPYRPGLLALREGPVLERAVRALAGPLEVLLVNATGRDHPRGAGLAVHLGAVLDLPTVGVTHRPLLAEGAWPQERRGTTSRLTLEGELVGAWLRTRARARPLAVHPGWRTDVGTAVEVVMATIGSARTPGPLRRARQAARQARAVDAAVADVRPASADRRD